MHKVAGGRLQQANISDKKNTNLLLIYKWIDPVLQLKKKKVCDPKEKCNELWLKSLS